MHLLGQWVAIKVGHVNKNCDVGARGHAHVFFATAVLLLSLSISSSLSLFLMNGLWLSSWCADCKLAYKLDTKEGAKYLFNSSASVE